MFDFIKKIVGRPESLRRRTFIAGNYSFGTALVNGITEFIRTAIFARILSPYDYGLMAIASIGITFLESFSTLGIEVQILKEKEDVEKKLAAYWTVKAMRGILLAFLACVLCYPLARYYQQPEIVLVMQIMSVGFLLRGFAGFGVEMSQRQLNFKNIFFTNSISSFLILAFSLVALYVIKDYWAIVAYQLFVAQSVIVISFILYRWKPKLAFDRSVFKDCMIFGSSIIIINILNYFFYNYDKAVLGKLTTLDVLGYYVRGYFLAMLPATHLANTIAQVIFPVLREAANDKVRLRTIYYKFFVVLTICFGGIGIVMAVLAKPIVLIIYGEKWLELIPVFRVLLVCGVLKSISIIFSPIFFIFNKPWLITLSTIITTVALLCLAVPLSKVYGMIGTGFAVVIAFLFAFVFSAIAAQMVMTRR